MRTFGTTTTGLLALADWLVAHGVEHVAMEATGVYWKPVWHVLEGQFELLLANAAHVKNVPGRKTDVNDATWIADLLAHGLIRASFVPPTPIQELRALTERASSSCASDARTCSASRRRWRTPTSSSASVLTDIMGKSGRAMIQAIIAGDSRPRVAALAHDRRVKASRDEVLEALRGHVTATIASCCKLHLEHIDALDRAIATDRTGGGRRPQALSRRRRTADHHARHQRAVASHVVLAEIGIDMSRFPTPAIWCPGRDCAPATTRAPASADRRGCAKAAPWLKTTLVQAAWAAVLGKESYLHAQFHRLRADAAPRRPLSRSPPRC